MLALQLDNLKRAYDRDDIDSECLEFITEKSLSQKRALLAIFGDVHQFTRKLTSDELDGLPALRNFAAAWPDYAFSWSSLQVTARATGKCYPFLKWCKNHGIEGAELAEVASQERQLFISAHPWFVLGASVGRGGCKPFNSCHNPGGEYSAGPGSYAMDDCSIVAGLWKNGGIFARMMIYLDPVNMGMVTSRTFGPLNAADCSAIRSEIYRLLGTEAWKKYKGFTVYKNDFRGYLDSDNFLGYRLSPGQNPDYQLAAPLCITCGDEHNGDTISCCSDNRSCCAHCGGRFRDGDMYYACDDIYCERCYCDLFSVCDRCGETITHDEMAKGTDYCKDCAERKGYSPCYSCGNWIDDYTVCNDECYCDDCLPEGDYCEKCGDYFETAELTKTIESEKYCEYCRGKHLDQCTTCQGWTDNGLTEVDDGTGRLCDDCIQEHTPCIVCGEYRTGENLFGWPPIVEANPVCSQECAANNLFGEV